MQKDKQSLKEDKRKEEYSGPITADMNAAAQQTQMDKFHATQGHGFAAEQANHLCDILSGKSAEVVGGDNAKDGADRLVEGVLIQTKYCRTATASVDAAFRDGRYRYINPDGSLMQLEVPADQYEKAVEVIAQKIQSGQVPGVSDPAEAKNIVRKGIVTYAQACNVAKFGTIESLTFDAANGAVICANTIGITATLVFARSLWNGESIELAAENAACIGIQTGGAAFATSVITAQLARTGLNSALNAPTKEIVRLLGSDTCAKIANALQGGANIYGAAAMNNVAKLFRGNLITSAVMTVVLSAKDIGHAFEGKISGKQLFKNITTVAGGMAGSIGGFMLGMALPVVGGPVAGVVVATATGGVAGKATNAVIGTFIEDDAVELVRIIQEEFSHLANDYFLTREEVDIITDDLSVVLTPDKLLDMYASSDRRAFADDLLRKLIEKLIRGRCQILLPNEEEFISGLGRVVNDASKGIGIFAPSYSATLDPMEVGKRLMSGQELTPRAAKKAMYATKQINLAQSQAEMLLKKMARDETETKKKLGTIKQEREAIKAELNELLGGN